MSVFKLTDKYIAFANDVAAGKLHYQAYIDNVAKNKRKVTKVSAKSSATKLVNRPEIQAIIEKARAARTEAIVNSSARKVGKEFSAVILTIDELDSFHHAVVQGLVEVEEVVPTYTSTYDKDGKLLNKVTSFVRVMRKPNVREKQISVAEIYKRGGHYAPNRFMGAFGRLGGDQDDELENVERFVILASGEKIPLLTDKPKT